MLIKYHEGLSDDNIEQQLAETLRENHFSGWNCLSICHLSFITLGIYGDKNKNIADQLFDSYIKWKSNNPKHDDGTFFGEPTIEYVNELRHNMKAVLTMMNNEGITNAQIRNALRPSH